MKRPRRIRVETSAVEEARAYHRLLANRPRNVRIVIPGPPVIRSYNSAPADNDQGRDLPLTHLARTVIYMRSDTICKINFLLGGVSRSDRFARRAYRREDIAREYIRLISEVLEFVSATERQRTPLFAVFLQISRSRLCKSA